jgi:4-amino-4-deoxy-L-arabinose transferase-like glycosyltransferase
MQNRRIRSLAAILKYMAGICAAGYILMFIVVALLRISYPFELEWMEGSMVDHVQRILSGKSLYVAPRMEFVPFLYPPLYFYLAAGVAAITGIGFLPLRLVSFASSLGVLALIGLMVRRETGKWSYGLLAAGVFAATYRACGAWLDIGRVDSLFLLLVLAAAYVLRASETRKCAVFSGLLLALAVLTKQTALAAAIPLFIYLLLVRRNLLLWALVPFAVVAGGVIIVLTERTNGWFWYYTVAGPSHHAIQLSVIPYVIAHDLLMQMGIAVCATVFYLYSIRGERKTRLFYGLLLLGMMLASLVPRLKTGGFANHLLPAYVAMAILLGLAVFQFIKTQPSVNRLLLIYASCVAQLLILFYNPAACLPTAVDRAAGQALLGKLAAVPGDVLLFSHGFLPALVGKNTTANYIAVTDVLSSGDSRATREMLNDFRDAIHTHRYSALILDNDDPLSWSDAAITKYYQKSEVAIDNPVGFWPVSGWPTRPAWIFVPQAPK